MIHNESIKYHMQPLFTNFATGHLVVSGNVAYFYQIGADPVVSVYMHSLISCTIITALYMSVM